MEKALKKIIYHLLKGSSINCLYRDDILRTIYVSKNGNVIIACHMFPVNRMTFNVSSECIGDIYEIMGWKNLYEDYNPMIVIHLIKDVVLDYIPNVIPSGTSIMTDIYHYLNEPVDRVISQVKTFVIK